MRLDSPHSNMNTAGYLHQHTISSSISAARAAQHQCCATTAVSIHHTCPARGSRTPRGWQPEQQLQYHITTVCALDVPHFAEWAMQQQLTKVRTFAACCGHKPSRHSVLLVDVVEGRRLATTLLSGYQVAGPQGHSWGCTDRLA